MRAQNHDFLRKIMASTAKERSAKLYRTRKENGLCQRCGTPLDRDGCYCSKCLEKVRIYQRECKDFYRLHGLCTQCGKNTVFGNERMCPECLAKYEIYNKNRTKEQQERYKNRFRIQQRNLYQERKAQGICTKCGKRKAMPGKRKCGICLEKDAEIHRIRCYHKIDERQMRIENRLCYYCGEPLDEDDIKICKDCMERCRRSGQKSLSMNKYWKMDNKIAFQNKGGEI